MGPKQNGRGKITQIFCEGGGVCRTGFRSGKVGVGEQKGGPIIENQYDVQYDLA